MIFDRKGTAIQPENLREMEPRTLLNLLVSAVQFALTLARSGADGTANEVETDERAYDQAVQNYGYDYLFVLTLIVRVGPAAIKKFRKVTHR